MSAPEHAVIDPVQDAPTAGPSSHNNGWGTGWGRNPAPSYGWGNSTEGWGNRPFSENRAPIPEGEGPQRLEHH